jgi:hypothetical protein
VCGPICEARHTTAPFAESCIPIITLFRFEGHHAREEGNRAQSTQRHARARVSSASSQAVLALPQCSIGALSSALRTLCPSAGLSLPCVAETHSTDPPRPTMASSRSQSRRPRRWSKQLMTSATSRSMLMWLHQRHPPLPTRTMLLPSCCRRLRPTSRVMRERPPTNRYART